MKRITKKLSLFLCLLLTCTVLASCGKEEALTEAEAYAASFSEELMTYFGMYSGALPELLENFAEYPVYYDSCENFGNAMEEYGRYISYETKSVSETDTNVFTVKGVAQFETCEVDVTSIVTIAIAGENRVTGEVTYTLTDAEPLTYDKVKTFGEKMGNAGLNTLLGMGIVFAVLILISFIISLFSLINKFEAKMAEKKKKNAPEKPVATAPKKAAPVQETEDTELVAVIAAAIAAAEGTSPDGIVVRSIRKVSSAKNWKRG